VQTVNGIAYDPRAALLVDDPLGAHGPRDDGVVLDEVAGVLERCGSGFCVAARVVDFGPQWWLQRTAASHDLDDDGAVEHLSSEITGLVGSRVRVEVERGAEGGDADVHSINGWRYRDSANGPPPWANGPWNSTPAGGRPSEPPGPPVAPGRPDRVGPPEAARMPGSGRPPGSAGPRTAPGGPRPGSATDAGTRAGNPGPPGPPADPAPPDRPDEGSGAPPDPGRPDGGAGPPVEPAAPPNPAEPGRPDDVGPGGPPGEVGPGTTAAREGDRASPLP
jgi:hypothetical protein